MFWRPSSFVVSIKDCFSGVRPYSGGIRTLTAKGAASLLDPRTLGNEGDGRDGDRDHTLWLE